MISMLILAFAGPHISDNQENTNKSEVALTAIYLDNSFSMQAESKKGQNFEQAKNIAKQIILNAPENMQYLILTNDQLPEHQAVIDKNTMMRFIDNTNISPKFLSISDIFLKAKTLCPKGENVNLYFISDVQKSIFDQNTVEIANNISTFFIPIQSQKPNNIFIDSCWFESPIHKLNQAEILNVIIKNQTNEDITNFSVHLYLNDSLKVMSSCDLLANEEKTLQLEYINTIIGATNGKLTISDYPIIYDNDLFFNYNVSEFSNVLIINENSTNKYLTTLFDVNKSDFFVTQNSINSLQTSDFENYNVIILNNIKEISSGLSSDLETYIKNGGSVVFVPSEDINSININNFIQKFNIGTFNNQNNKDTKIAKIDYENEIFKNVFQRQNQQADFPIISQSYKLNRYNNSSFMDILKDENSSPLLVFGTFGAGKILLFTFPFNEKNSSFLKSSIFVPIMLNFSLSGNLNYDIYSDIGNNSKINVIPKGTIENSETFKITNNTDFETYTDFRIIGKKIEIYPPETIINAGFYSLIDINNKKIASVSFNFNRKESDLTYMTNEDLQKFIIEKMDSRAKIISSISKNINSQLKDISQGQQLWFYFILLAIIFIICEVLLIKFFK